MFRLDFDSDSPLTGLDASRVAFTRLPTIWSDPTMALSYVVSPLPTVWVLLAGCSLVTILCDSCSIFSGILDAVLNRD